MSCLCLRRVISLWHQTTDLSLSLAFFAKSSNTFSLPTLSSTLMGRVSCMISSMALEKRSHVRPSSSCSLRISRGMPDFSKDFDKVNHSKLLWKLHQYGIRGRELAWIRAFLGSRSQQVVIDGEESESIPVTSGVPPGLRPGPDSFPYLY